MTISTTRRIAHGFSRRTLLGRAALSAAGAIGYMWTRPSRSVAATGPGLRVDLEGCNFDGDLHEVYKASDCTKRWGGASSNVSGPITVYSPTEVFWLYTYAYCPAGAGNCTPRLFQVWGLACNDGRCDDGWVPAT